MGILESLFGGGNSDPYALYGDLFTPQQKAALQQREQSQNLLKMAAAFGQAGMPSRLPVPMGAVLGQVAGSLAGNQDEAAMNALRATLLGQQAADLKSKAQYRKDLGPTLETLGKALGAWSGGGAPAAAPTVAGVPAVPAVAAASPVGGPLAAPAVSAAANAFLNSTAPGLLGPGSEIPSAAPDAGSGYGAGGVLAPKGALILDTVERPAAAMSRDGGPSPVASLAAYAIGNAAPGMPSSVEGVKAEFAQRINNMAQDMPEDIRQKFNITSGFRSVQRNKDVYAALGLPPTNSLHSQGVAVDTTKDPDVLNWINQNGPKYGVDYTIRHMPGEENHLEMLSDAGGRMTGTRQATPGGPDTVIPSGSGGLPILRAQASGPLAAPSTAPAIPGGGPLAAGGTTPAIPPGGATSNAQLNAVMMAIAAARAKAVLGGLEDPFGPYMDAITKSPQYLQQTERIKEGVGLEYAGPKAAAIAKANDPFLRGLEEHKSALARFNDLISKGVVLTPGGELKPASGADALAAVDILKESGKPSSEIKEYLHYAAQERLNGIQPKSYEIWDLQRRRANAMQINTTEGFDAAQRKALLELDKKVAQDAAEKALTARNLRPLAQEILEIADKTPSGMLGQISAAMAGNLSALGLPVTAGMSNAEAMRSMTQRLIPLIREPGATAASEMNAYLAASPGLSQSPEGRRKIATMIEKMSDRAQEVAEVYRANMGKDTLYPELKKLDKPLFSPEERAALEGEMRKPPTAAAPGGPPAGATIRTYNPATGLME